MLLFYAFFWGGMTSLHSVFYPILQTVSITRLGDEILAASCFPFESTLYYLSLKQTMVYSIFKQFMAFGKKRAPLLFF